MVAKRTKTSRIPVTLTEEQVALIDSLVGSAGSSQSDVISKIIVMWAIEHDKLEVKGKR